MQTNLQWQKASKWLPKARSQGEICLQKVIRRLLGVVGPDKNLSLDCAGGFMSIYICQNFKWIQLIVYFI